MFALYQEDMLLCDEKWNEKYPEMRIIFWDGTNVDLKYKSSVAKAESLTYSLYYGGNIAKGGLGLQKCGWIVNCEL